MGNLASSLKSALAFAVYDCSACPSADGSVPCSADHCTLCNGTAASGSGASGARGDGDDDVGYCQVKRAFGLDLLAWKYAAEEFPSLLRDEMSQVRLSSNYYNASQVLNGVELPRCSLACCLLHSCVHACLPC